MLINAVEYGLNPALLELALPYRPKTETSDFAVYRPVFLGGEESDFETVADAFFDGADSHEEAATVWNAHLAETA